MLIYRSDQRIKQKTSAVIPPRKENCKNNDNVEFSWDKEAAKRGSG